MTAEREGKADTVPTGSQATAPTDQPPVRAAPTGEAAQPRWMTPEQWANAEMAAEDREAAVPRETPVQPTAPEPAADLVAQLRAVADPANPKDAMFVARGQQAPEPPPGVFAATRPEGTLLTTNRAKLAAFQNPAPITDAQMARILEPGEVTPATRAAAPGAPPAAPSAGEPAPSVLKPIGSGEGKAHRHRIGIALFVALVVAGGVTFWINRVGTGSSPDRSELDAPREAERVLMQDQEKAIPVLLSRLQHQVRLDGDMILIEGGPPLNTLHAFPSRVTWHIECDALGLSVAFTGSGALEDSPGAVEITLTNAEIKLDQCRRLIPPVAAMLAGFGGR